MTSVPDVRGKGAKRMGYIESNLLSDEQVVYAARLHWIIFLKSFALVFLGMIFLLIQPIIGAVVIIIGLAAADFASRRLLHVGIRRDQ